MVFGKKKELTPVSSRTNNNTQKEKNKGEPPSAETPKDGESSQSKQSGSSSCPNSTWMGRRKSSLKHKFKKASTVVLRTPYPEALVKSLAEFDDYRNKTEAVFYGLINVVQPNPEYRTLSKTRIKLTPTVEPHLALHAELSQENIKVTNNPKLKEELAGSVDVLGRLATVQKEFFATSEKKLPKLLFFVKVFVVGVEEKRATMDQARDNVDIAKRTYKKAGSASKLIAEKNLDTAAEEYKKSANEVMDMLTALPQLKKIHLAEIEGFFAFYAEFELKRKEVLLVALDPRNDRTVECKGPEDEEEDKKEEVKEEQKKEA